MLEKVRRWCSRQHLFVPGERILIACSGGADSLALTDVLLQLQQPLQLQLYVAHLDHMLRGDASRADAAFVHDFCLQHGLVCFIQAADVASYASKHRMSDEMAAREVRYAFLRETAAAIGGAKIATAHHRDDQAETVLLHLLRGSGSCGLGGIRPAADGIIRPFLGVTRAEIETYCRERKLAPRHDATNDQTEYTRNRLRLELLPQLRERYNPAIVEVLCRSAEILADEHEFIHEYAWQQWPAMTRIEAETVIFDRQRLQLLPPAVQRELFRLGLKQVKGDLNGFSFLHIEKLLAFNADGQTGAELMLPQGIRIRCRYDDLEIFRITAQRSPNPLAKIDFETVLAVPGITQVQPLGLSVTAEIAEKFPDLRKSNSIICDADKLEGSLVVRCRRPGDRFSPSGVAGSKKIKEYFIDQKIDRERREFIPLFCDKNEIFWVGNYRQNQMSQPGPATKRCLRLTINKLPDEENLENDEK